MSKFWDRNLPNGLRHVRDNSGGNSYHKASNEAAIEVDEKLKKDKLNATKDKLGITDDSDERNRIHKFIKNKLKEAVKNEEILTKDMLLILLKEEFPNTKKSIYFDTWINHWCNQLKINLKDNDKYNITEDYEER